METGTGWGCQASEPSLSPAVTPIEILRAKNNELIP